MLSSGSMRPLAVWLALTATLAGCVRALPDTPPEPPMCESYTIAQEYDVCCDDCGTCWGTWCGEPPRPTPTPAWPTPTVVPARCYNDTSFTPPLEPCAVPLPPLFEPFGLRYVRECQACGEVAMVVDGERIYIATAEGLDVVTPTRLLSAPAPIPSAVEAGWTLRSPAVATDGVDVWYAALARASMGLLPPFDALVVARWDGGGGWIREQVVPMETLPHATPATRVLLAATRDGVVALLETDAGAWSLRLADDAATPEPIGEPGARLRFGTPARDAEGRSRVPYARDPQAPLDAGMATPGIATLPDLASAWSLADAGEGAWSLAGPPPALETFPGDGAGLALTWLNEMGAVVRTRSLDGGATWDDPFRWRDAGHATSPVAAAQGQERATLAWNEDDRLVLARGTFAPEGTIEMARETRSAPTLALMGPRAVVAWLSPEDGLSLAREGTWDPECDDTAHCRRAYY